MNPLFILFIIILSIYVAIFLISYVCYFIVFRTTKRLKRQKEFSIPSGKVYLPHKEKLIELQKETKLIPCEDIEIKSFDNLTLRGKFYEYEKGAPIEIMFHGYRGNSQRDMAGGVQRCFKLKRSALLCDQRGQASSDGFLISFGDKEKFDALSWANYCYERFGDNVNLLLTGISMGASTVLLASELELPPTVKGIIADCGYSSAEKIIKSVMKKMHFPTFIFYPILNFGANLFGDINLDKISAENAVKNAKVPVCFIHGKTDDFVPPDMSEENFNACKTEKDLLLVDGAGHGLAFIIAPDDYIETLSNFDKKIGL